MTYVTIWLNHHPMVQCTRSTRPRPKNKSNHINSCKLSIYFAQKTTFSILHTFLQNIHINLSIVHIYLIKYSFFYNFFFIISSLTILLSHKPNTTKNTKILNARATVTVHICMVTIALVHLCTIYTHWCGFFLLKKMCKTDYFLYFAWVDTIALR